MEQLDKLKKKRSSVRASITKTITKVDNLIETNNNEIEHYLEALEQLNEKDNSLKKLNIEIENIITLPKDYEIEINASEEYDDNIIKTKHKIKSHIKRLEDKSTHVMSPNLTVPGNSTNIKLPDIPLPKFSGKYEEWSSFKSQFNNIITFNGQLSDTQKLHYLSAALINEAKELQTTDDTFTSLFHALEERYENTRVIVDIHINAILDIEKLTQSSAKDLRSLVDNVKKNIRALKVLEYDRNNLSDALILNIVLQKLDKETRKQYELSISSNEFPKLDELIAFLEKRSQILESINKTMSVKPKVYQDRTTKSRTLFMKSNHSINSCVLCKENHPLFKCDSFLRLNAVQRKEIVSKNNMCFNCLSDKHIHNVCKSKRSCNICQKRHNSLLHRNSPLSILAYSDSVNEVSAVYQGQALNPKADAFCYGKESAATAAHTLWCTNKENKSVVLSTALVWVYNHFNGIYLQARAILDSGSMTNIVTAEFANRLGLPQERMKIAISSLGGNETNVRSKIKARITNGNGSFQTSLDFLVVPKITDFLPVAPFNVDKLKIPQELADPKFTFPSKIDMLIGAEAFYDIVKGGEIRTSDNLVFRSSVFGYIATGTVNASRGTQYCGFTSQAQNIDDCLQKFWQLETIDEPKKILSKEEEYCEDHYQITHERNEAGRYVVKMPMKDSESLGDSRRLAEKRLDQLCRRLSKDKEMKDLYQKFMQEYLELGHMERITDFPSEHQVNNSGYYLPHHGVVRPDKTTTKLRVVFNASAVTTSGFSLNDLLLKGEVKEDIFEIMTRFRKHQYAFTADVQKMFRQILIDPQQRDFLKIVWKTEETEEPVTYRLKTVTYGTSSAPFLAIRTLKQLAIDEASRFPLASEILQMDVYMDDIVSGAQNLETAKELQHQLCGMLETCGMTLHKWNSNAKELMNSSSLDQQHNFATDVESAVKTLGVIWKPNEDQFIFKVSITEKSSYSKRDVLSVIARLYDPLGFLGPVITRAKIFLQKLWLMKLNWEDELPEPIASYWTKFVSSLKAIEDIRVNRYILKESFLTTELIGFADASESAYGAVVYMKCTTENGDVTTSIVASKSRVAPLKTISIPRLELSACLLLSQLIEKVRLALKMKVDDIILHTDSTIAIAWIKTPANRLKTFIGNRVSKIQSLTENYQWKHVSSHLNPADVISRGLGPQEISTMTLWWHGPQCLQYPSEDSRDNSDISSDELYLSELKKMDTVSLVSTSDDHMFLNDFLNLSNNFVKLIRILSYVFRFIYNTTHSIRRMGPLTTEELRTAKVNLIKRIQVLVFGSEIKTLQKGEIIQKGQVSCLHPFLDKHNLLRVGGRLSNSDLSYDKKFPILLPKDHKLTLIIMTYFHLKYLHVGAQTLLYLVRQEFWPLNGRNTARKIVHNCIICFKNKPRNAEQIMGDLPPERVNPSSPFTHVGIDFCGPFYIKYKGQRKGIYHKCYVAIFICLVTKAIHLEVVTELTSEAMIATLKRFFSRRGKSSSICTDNATNFIGANTELKRLGNLVRNPSDDLAQYLANEEIAWKFIPPRSPNFGGLWEAGVKSFKHHLKRTVGNSRLTFEQFLTVTSQIEGILNSRPLTPMSSDPNNFEVLTPGHFLIGRPLSSVPEPDLVSVRDNYLSQWQKLNKMTQIVWRKWKLDYLNNLQARHKWQFEKDNIIPNSMVLLKEDNLPPCKWTMGRIEKVIKAPDGKVRVVLIKTPQGVFKRGISKICLLPQC